MVEWPQVNDQVVLVRDDGEHSRTRVEDEGDGMLAVGDPLDDGWHGETGREYELQWPPPRGLVAALTVLHRVQGGSPPLWWLEPLEHPSLHQRRSFVRASAEDTAMHVVWTGLIARGRHKGQLLDLSEGGARGIVPAYLAAQPGEAVHLQLETDAGPLELSGAVLRATKQPAGTEIVVTFDDLPDQLADQVRQLVFSWQRAARR